MARIFKEEEYNTKRDEILDFASRLGYSKGFEQMTIQDILDGLHISRGALYHYFDSKQALLEALVIRMGSQAVNAFLPVLHDPQLTAIQKFRAFFDTSVRWKTAGKELIASSMRIWYTDENALFRHKLTAESLLGMAGILESIIHQGIDEKTFTTRYPDQAAAIIAGVALTMGNDLGRKLFTQPATPSTLQEIGIFVDAYFDAIERIIGAPPGSLKVFEGEDFKDWLGIFMQDPAPSPIPTLDSQIPNQPKE